MSNQTAEEIAERETINKLFLELSQFVTAKTKRELELESRLQSLKEEVEELPVSTSGEVYLLERDAVLALIEKHLQQ